MMNEDEEEIHRKWIEDETGRIDLCRFCIKDANHPTGVTCTGFRWNGKKFVEVYPKKEMSNSGVK